jgi:hypothetical protein
MVPVPSVWGSEFLVNSTTAGDQHSVALGAFTTERL